MRCNGSMTNWNLFGHVQKRSRYSRLKTLTAKVSNLRILAQRCEQVVGRAGGSGQQRTQTT